MIIGTPAEGPEIFAIRFLDRKVIDACDAPLHQAIRIKFPILVAIRPKPIPAVVMPFIGKPDRDPIFMKRPQLLDQPIIQLFRPFPGKKLHDRLPALDKFRAIPPDTVHRISQRDFSRIAAVPAVFRQAYFLYCGIAIKRWQGWSLAHPIFEF